MALSEPQPGEASQARRDAIARSWLERTLDTYPPHSARFLRETQDPFRNPVGHALKSALPALLEEMCGQMDAMRVSSLLEGIVRIRAVQDFSPSQALGFVFLLKEVLGQEAPDLLRALEARIDQVALLGFDLYMQCRERLAEVRVNEARRRNFVPERIAGKR